MTGNQARAFLIAEDHAADSVDRKYSGWQLMLAHVLGTAAHRSARAGRAEEVVNKAVQLLDDLPHGLVMSARVIEVAVLVGPKTVRSDSPELLYPRNSRRQIFAGRAIGNGNQIDFSAERFENFDVQFGGLWIDHADEAEPVIGANLCQADAH